MTKSVRGWLALGFLAIGVGLKIYYSQNPTASTPTTNMISDAAIGAGAAFGATYLL